MAALPVPAVAIRWLRAGRPRGSPGASSRVLGEEGGEGARVPVPDRGGDAGDGPVRRLEKVAGATDARGPQVVERLWPVSSAKRRNRVRVLTSTVPARSYRAARSVKARDEILAFLTGRLRPE